MAAQSPATYDAQTANLQGAGQQVMALSMPVVLASNQTPIPVSSGGIQAAPLTLFDAAVNAVVATLSATLFPGALTITGGLPAVGSGGIATLKSGANIVGAVFAPGNDWASVLLDFAAVITANKAITLEIGRVATSGAYAQVLASVVLTSITAGGTIGPTLVNPFTGEAHASVTWVLFDKTVITAKSQLGAVLQSIGGAQDGTPSQLSLDCSASEFVYVIVTAEDASLTELLLAITPGS